MDLLGKKQEYFEGLLVFNGGNVTLFNMFSSIAYMASFIIFFLMSSLWPIQYEFMKPIID